MGFFGGGASQASTTPKVTGIQVQTSVSGSCKVLFYGTQRIAGNLLWYGDFQAIPHEETAGKGGAGGYTTYTYKASVVVGLCRGPATVIKVFKNKKSQTLTKSGFTVFAGNIGQTPWGYLTTNHPTKAIGYSGLCYAAKSNYKLGDSAQFENLNWEVQGPCRLTGNADCDPSVVVADILTEAGFPSTRLGSLTTYSDYCLSANLLISPAYTDQRTAAEMIQEICDLTNSAPVWSADRLTIIPYGDEYLSGNGATYSPPSSPLYDLTDDDFMDHEQPVKLSRIRPSDRKNQIVPEFLNRSNNYNTETIDDIKDNNAIELYGLRCDGPKTMHIFCVKAIAKHAGQLLLQREAIGNIYTFQVGWQYIGPDPMDIVTLTDLALGCDRQWVRIRTIEEDDEGLLTIEAEEYLEGTGAAAQYTFQDIDGYTENRDTDPGLCNTPIIFEAPAALDQQLELCIAVSGGADWGGCAIYASTDGSTYKQIGELEGNSRMGVLSAQLLTGTSPDSTHTLAVDLTESRGELIGGTQQDAELLNTLCYCDGEWLAFETATLTAANKYNLTYLVRGAYGSAIGTHAVNSQFCRIDPAVVKYIFGQEMIGQTIYIKCLGRNLWGFTPGDISDCTAYPYTITGLALSGLAITIANEAMSEVDDAADDKKISPSEKATLIEDWIVIQADATPVTGKMILLAAVFGVSTTAYAAAYSALKTYIETKLHLFDNMNASTRLSAKSSSKTEWIAKWGNYYNAYKDLVAACHQSRPKTYRVVSRGTSSTYGTAPGMRDDADTAISAGGSSYTVVVLTRADPPVLVSTTTYDVHASGTNATAMANALNALGSNKIVVIYTSGDPKLNRNAALKTAIYRCGGSKSIYNSKNFKTASAYALIGYPGCKQGNGTEYYSGDVDNDADAWIDIHFSVKRGNISLSGGTVKDAGDLAYSDDSYVDDLKPAEAGAEATTGKSITLLTGRTLDNIADGTRKAVASIDANGLAMIDFSQSHSGKGALATQNAVGPAFANLVIKCYLTLSPTITAAAPFSLFNPSTGLSITLTSAISLTLNLANVGANGRDTSTAVAAHQKYYFYVIYNPTTQTVAGLASLSATSPTLPSGYTYYRLCGIGVTQSTTQFYLTHQYDYELYHTAPVQIASGVTSAGWTSVDISNWVPPTPYVPVAFIAVGLTAWGSGNVRAFISANNSDIWAGHEVTFTSGLGPGVTVPIPFFSTPNIYLSKAGGGTGEVGAWLMGFRLAI